MDNKEINYSINNKLENINLKLDILKSLSDTLNKNIDTLYNSGKVSQSVSSTNIHKVNTLKDDINKLKEEINNNLNSINKSNISLSNLDKLNSIINNITDIDSNYQNNFEYKSKIINNFDIKGTNIIDRNTKNDILSYKELNDTTKNKINDVIKIMRDVSNKSLNGLDYKEVSNKYNKYINNNYNDLINRGLIQDAKKEISNTIGKYKGYSSSINSKIDLDKNEINSGKLSNSDIEKSMIRIANNKKRLIEINKYIDKQEKLLSKLFDVEHDMIKNYNLYTSSVDSGDILVNSEKYSFVGNMRRYSRVFANTISAQGYIGFISSLSRGKDLRISNYNNGVGSTMLSLANSENLGAKSDNKIEKYIDNIGISNGTHTTSKENAELLGAYTSSNRLGNVNDYKNQVDEATKFSTYTGAGVDSTSDLIKAIGLAGGINPSNNLNNLYGAIANSNMIGRASEQTEALSSMLSNTNNIGNMSTSNINDTIVAQQQMANTGLSSLQGQQGAQAFNNISDVVTNTQNPVIRGVASDVFGIKQDTQEGKFKLSMKMEEAKKDPKQLSKLLNGLTKHFGDDEEASAEFIAQQSGGKVSRKQSLELVKLAKQGKLTKKKLNAITSKNKKGGKGTTRDNLEKAIHGSGNFKINLYLAVDQKTDSSMSMATDGIRKISNSIFANHPILGNMVGLAGSAIGSAISTSLADYATNKVLDHWDRKRNSKSGKTTNHIKEENSKSISKDEMKNATENSGKPSFVSSSKGTEFSFKESLKGNVKGMAISAGIGLALNAITNNSKDEDDNDEEPKAKKQLKHKEYSSENYDKSNNRNSKKVESLWDQYYERGIRIVNQAMAISNIIKPKDSSSQSSTSDTNDDNKDKKDKDNKKDTKSSNKKDSKKEKSKKKEEKKEHDDTKDMAQFSTPTSVGGNIGDIVDKIFKHGSGGLISTSSNGGINDELLKEYLVSDSGKQLNESYSSSNYDLLTLSAKSSNNNTNYIKENYDISPNYNVDLNIKNKNNYTIYVDAINSALEEYTNILSSIE